MTAPRKAHDAHIHAWHAERARRADLVAANLGLVWTVVQRHFPHAPLHLIGDSDDMFQTGVLGLCVAAEKFDPSRGVTFGTYAGWWIRHAVGRALERGGLIRVPTHLQRGPTADRDVVVRVRHVVSLDVPSGDDGATLAESVPGRGAGELDPSWADEAAELERLPGQYRAALEMRRGEGLTVRETARRLKVGEPTVRDRVAVGERLLVDRVARRRRRRVGEEVAS